MRDGQEIQQGSWRQQWDRLLRCIGSAFIFGVALLYTMEVWWLGMTVDLWKMLLFLVFILLLSIFLGKYGGFCEDKRISLLLFRAVESLAIGLVVTLICLFALNRLVLQNPLDEIIGKTMLMTIPFAIGAFLADAIIPLLGNRLSGADGQQDEREELETNPMAETLKDIGATIAGGIFLAFPIAPTEEVPMLATELTYWHLMALVVLTLIASYIIVFACESGDEIHSDSSSSALFLHRPLIETVLCYAISLVMAFCVLWFFDQIEMGMPLRFAVAQVLVLSFPLAIGGAAGRLAI